MLFLHCAYIFSWGPICYYNKHYNELLTGELIHPFQTTKTKGKQEGKGKTTPSSCPVETAYKNYVGNGECKVVM